MPKVFTKSLNDQFKVAFLHSIDRTTDWLTFVLQNITLNTLKLTILRTLIELTQSHFRSTRKGLYARCRPAGPATRAGGQYTLLQRLTGRCLYPRPASQDHPSLQSLLPTAVANVTDQTSWRWSCLSNLNT